MAKNIFTGPSTEIHSVEPFVPSPIDTSNVVLPAFAQEIHLKFAENLHELWAMKKIDLGWIFGEVHLIFYAKLNSYLWYICLGKKRAVEATSMFDVL